jgi:hypothetical protein
MKKLLSIGLLATVVVLSAVSVPVFADEARHEARHANREVRRAVDSRTNAAVDRMEGHPIRAEVEAKHARHEEHRAIKHEGDAVMDR